MSWSKIKQISNWGSYWTLDGEKLKNGAQLDIKWPDKSVESVTVTIIRHVHQGHGGMSETTVDEECRFLIQHRGAEVFILATEEMRAQWQS